MSESIPKIKNLKIKVRSKFNIGGRYTPLDIRDSDLTLVKRNTTDREFSLECGLYEVSTYLGDGKRASRIVEIIPDQIIEIEFEPEFDYQPESPTNAELFKPVESLNQSYLEKTRLLNIDADFSVYSSENYWIVHHREAMKKVSVITIAQDGKLIQASLPVSKGHHYSDTCHIKQSTESKVTPVQINISQKRSVAFCLESMLKTGQTIKAANVAADAMALLINKYTDPTGALLAALALYKTDQLDNYSLGLLRNLTKYHKWLPDCKILLALHLSSFEKSEETLRLACEASHQRILLTECFSLLLDLLRYWPESNCNEQRNEALSRLAKIAPFVSWGSMYLTTTVPGGQVALDTNAART